MRELSSRDFESCVEEALASVPPVFRKYLENVVVVVEEEPCREDYDEWLAPHKLETDADRERMLALLQHVSGEVAATITTYEVDRRVNNSRAIDPTDPSLIAPIAI